MERKQFLKGIGLAGLGTITIPFLAACKKSMETFSGRNFKLVEITTHLKIDA